jgi:hypothetical protein
VSRYIEWLAECNEIHIDFRAFADNMVEIVIGIGWPNWRNDMRVSGLQ